MNRVEEYMESNASGREGLTQRGRSAGMGKLETDLVERHQNYLLINRKNGKTVKKVFGFQMIESIPT